MNRRSAIGILSAIPAISFFKDAEAAVVKKKIRIVHITDTHIQPENSAPQHTRRCLEQIASLKDKPDMILHTGDVIMDALFADKDRTAQQWKIWKDVSKDLKIPVKYAIGNHDIWSLKKTGTAPLYGKQWAVDEMTIPNRYYSFKKDGWHFIVLDSNLPSENDTNYTAGIDEEQFEWLSGELKKISATTPIVIASHIPIMSASIISLSACENNVWTVKASLMHSDAHRLHKLFTQHPNVKLCISGHLHLLDTVVYDGLTYMGTGAICGYWWKENTFHQTKAGYSIIDLFPNGTFNRYYEEFKW